MMPPNGSSTGESSWVLSVILFFSSLLLFHSIYHIGNYPSVNVLIVFQKIINSFKARRCFYFIYHCLLSMDLSARTWEMLSNISWMNGWVSLPLRFWGPHGLCLHKQEFDSQSYVIGEEVKDKIMMGKPKWIQHLTIYRRWRGRCQWLKPG